VAVVRVAVVLSGNCPRWQFHKKSFNRFFKTVRYFRDPIQVLRISENRVPTIREIGFLQVHAGYLTFSLKKLGFNVGYF